MNSQVSAVKSEILPNSACASSEVTSSDSALFVAYFSVCSVCGEQFLLQDDLHKHMVTHSLTHPVSCRKCLFRCRTGAELAEHIKKDHSTQIKRRKESFNQVDRRLRCAKCGIDSFPGYSSFKNHHIFHLVTQPESRVLLERLDLAVAALASVDEEAAAAGAGASLKLRLRRDSRASSEPSDQFKVVMTDTGSDSGVDVNSVDLLAEKSALNCDALYMDADIDQLSESTDGFDPADQNGTTQLRSDMLMDGELDVNGLPIDLHALEGDDQHEDVADQETVTVCETDFDALLRSDAAGAVDGAELGIEECEGGEEDLQAELEAKEESNTSDEAASNGSSRSLPPPPSLLPVSSLTNTEDSARESSSAPPPSLHSPAERESTERSASSEPGDGCSVRLHLEDSPTAVSLPGPAAKEAGVSAEPNASTSGSDEQPVIRMAAIAANIPDERSFRQEAGVSCPPLPPQLQQRPPPMLSLAASHLNSPAVTVSGAMPPLRPALGPMAVPAFPNTAPNLGAPGAPVSSQSVVCFVCRVVLPNVRALQEHLVTAHSSLQCTMCMYKASSVNDLRAHCLSLHGGPNGGVQQRATGSTGVFVPPRLGPLGVPGAVMANGSMHALQQQHNRMPGIGPGLRRGRPPLRSRMAESIGAPMMMSAAGGRPMMMGRSALSGHQIGPRVPHMVGQKRPGVSGLGGESPLKRRPNIPIQSDKSDCQVISVQRRQQGMPRIQNVEGNAGAVLSAHAGDGAVQQQVRTSGQSADVTSVLANRGISVTPASGAALANAASRGAAVSLPNLPAGISLTPANTSSAAAAAPVDGTFAVPTVPPRRDSGVHRPTRPPTVDLTVDNPVRPASLACRYCPRQFTTNLALQQHEKSHLTSPAAAAAGGGQQLRCRVCGLTAVGAAQLHQHVLKRHPGVPVESAVVQVATPGGGAAGGGRVPDLVVPVFDLAMVSREQLDELGVRGFLPVSQVNQRQGQLGLPIISLDGLGKSGPSPRPAGFFNLGPMRLLR